MPSSPESVDRFLWTSASSDSEDSEMSNSDIKEHDLSKTKEQIKLDPDQSIDSADERRRSRKKRKLSPGSEDELECKIKTELASDAETYRHKKRRKQNDTVTEDVARDDSYLEQESFIQPSAHIKHKKKKKSKGSLTDQSHSDNDEGLSLGTQIEEKQDQDKTNSNCESTDNTISIKKKKKKHKKDKKMHNDMEIEDEFSAAETVILSPPRSGIQKQRKQHNSMSSSYLSADSDTPRKSRLNSEHSSGSEAELERKIKAEHQVKTEQASDAESSRHKKRRQQNDTATENVARDDSYLEQESFVQPSAHIKHKKKSKRSLTDQSHSDNDEGLPSGTQIKHKKEKKKYNDMEVEDEFSAAETVIQSPPRNGIHKQRTQHNSMSRLSADSDTPRKSRLNSEHSSGSEAELGRKIKAEHQVKTEQASDAERSRHKKRRQQNNTATENVVRDDSYLEQESFVQPSVHIKHKKKSKRSLTDQSHSDNDEGLSSGTQIKHKKEKKKYNDMEVEDEFSAAETVIQSPPRSGIHKQRTQHNSMSSSYLSADSDTPRKSRLNTQSSSGHEASAKTNTTAQHSDSDSPDDDSCATGTKVSRSKSMIVTSIPEGPTRKLGISERIAYEDDLDETVQSEPQSQNVKHNLIKKYLKQHSLQNIEMVIPRSTLTPEDDVWIIKCPQEITSSCLSAVELPVEGKCKIKVDGNTYDGSVEEPDMGHVNVKLCPDGKYHIQSVALKGELHFRRRIPKPHVRQDDTMVNKQRFIPLPETKIRHPLLGADYRAALKLPAHVARRLAEPRADHAAADRPSKKRGREQPATESADDQLPPRGRKATSADEEPTPKRKKSKRKPDAAAWDSAQAIEENLFNF